MCSLALVQSILFLVLLGTRHVLSEEVELRPKMTAELMPQHRRSLVEEDPEPFLSDSVIFLGRCPSRSDKEAEEGPLRIPLSAGEGIGYIGLINNPKAEVFVTASSLLEASGGTINLDLDTYTNIFSAVNDNHDDGTTAKGFSFQNIPSTGGEMILRCSEKVDVMVAYKDYSGVEVGYQVSTSVADSSSSSNPRRTGTVVLTTQTATHELQAKAFVQEPSEGSGRRRGLVESKQVHIHDETESGLQYDFGEAGDIILAQAEIEVPATGEKVYRSIVIETRDNSLELSDLASLKLDSAHVDSDGDLHFKFKGNDAEMQSIMDTERGFLLKAMVAVEVDGQGILEESRIELRALTRDFVLNLHGGWIRSILNKAGFGDSSNPSCPDSSCWKIVVPDAVIIDTLDSYRVIAHLSGPTDPAIDQHKELLSNPPTEDEKNVSEEMKHGRVPEEVRHMRRRLEQGETMPHNHKKILVHGYCAEENPFPLDSFSDAIPFSDPGDVLISGNGGDARHGRRLGAPPQRRRRMRLLGSTDGLNNWSNEEFALKIGIFAMQHDIISCGIVAHSQGGLAALHLYSYYWSCLDVASFGGNNLIQSVGSPYQGTNLSELARLGVVFGVGCGTNEDLTVQGATQWLANIPYWARSAVHYWTTAHDNRGRRFLSFVNYCNLASLSLLNGEDDGTVELARGQLPGGHYEGHDRSQCHGRGMNGLAQYEDATRNGEMNTAAHY